MILLTQLLCLTLFNCNLWKNFQKLKQCGQLIISITVSQNHRTVEIGRDHCRSSGPTDLLKRDHLQLVAQDHIQAAFEQLQGWRLHNRSGQSMTVLGHSHSEKVFPDLQIESPVCVRCLLSCHWTPLKSTWLHLLYAFLTGIYLHWWNSPIEPSLLQAKLSQFSQPFLTEEMLQSLNHLSSPLLDCLQQLGISLVLGDPELNAAPQVWPY